MKLVQKKMVSHTAQNTKKPNNTYKESQLEECKIDMMEVSDKLKEEFQEPKDNMMFNSSKDNYIKRPFIYSLKRAWNLQKKFRNVQVCIS